MALVSAALDIRYITPSRHPSPAGPPPPNDSPQAKQKHLEAHLGAAPVPALGVIPATKEGKSGRGGKAGGRRRERTAGWAAGWAEGGKEGGGGKGGGGEGGKGGKEGTRQVAMD
jgi:hypothetical protein